MTDVVIVTRAGKGAPLTWAELDANFVNLADAVDAGGPGGASNEVQINSGGAFAGAAGFTFNNATRTLALTGQSLTAAQADPVLDLATTWNTTGVPAAIRLNVTNTLSGVASKLLDLQVDGVSMFQATKNGSAQIGSGSAATQGWILGNVLSGYSGLWTTGTQSATNYILQCAGNGFATYLNGNNLYFRLQNADKMALEATRLLLVGTPTIAWNTGGIGTAADVGLTRNAAGLLEINNGTAGQFRDLTVRSLRATGMPTAVTGLPAGTLWNNAGVVNVAP